jgi:hypothetical protein
LAGKAEQFFRVEGVCVENFEDLRVMFMERFQGGDVVTVEIDFHQCQQNPAKLVVDYAQRFKVLATMLYDDYIQVKPVQMTILRKFLEGLNGDIQRWVCSRNPRNFEEAFKIARKEEINLRMSRRQGGNGRERKGTKIFIRHIRLCRILSDGSLEAKGKPNCCSTRVILVRHLRWFEQGRLVGPVSTNG